MGNHKKRGLYNSSLEHDSCGIGFIADLNGTKSNKIVSDALHMLECMEHRGGTGFDKNSGDGAGILMQIPHNFFAGLCEQKGITLADPGNYGIGVVFFPKNAQLKQKCRTLLEDYVKKLDLDIIYYRKVPTDNFELGEASKTMEPSVEHFVIPRPESMSNEVFERKMFVARRYSNRVINQELPELNDQFYIVSLSSKTLIYKGQLTTRQLKKYYLDLQNPEIESAIALIHSRFSTNTFPAWKLAQPFRYIAHNGEINTLRGNLNWMKSRENLFKSEFFSDEEMNMLLPVCDPRASDSANLDMVIELLTLSGRSLPHVMMMLIPEAWQENKKMEEHKRAFYEYNACIMEPWDGPASICFTDGKIVGATLDRNGLRPSRYLLTKDNLLVMGSETGILEIDPANVAEKGRLQPGKMFIADIEQGRIISDDELKRKICTQKPYKEWLEQNKIVIDDLPDPEEYIQQPTHSNLIRRQQVFGYSTEDVRVVLKKMIQTGQEAIGSMGNDTPLAVLSHQSQHISHYFKQLFAQVTNPPIDAIRERLVMALQTYAGDSKNLLEETPDHCHKIELIYPVLTNRQLTKIRYVDHDHFQNKTIDMIFRADGLPGRLERALDKIARYAVDAIEDGFSIIVLSDRGVDSDHAAIPSLLAVSTIHHKLISKGLRGKADIIVEAGDIRETHHFATVLGYGASAVNPYMAIETLIDLRDQGQIDRLLSNEEIEQKYIYAICKGLLKIFSKMGISTLQSYQGAQIFEAIGINSEVIDKYFPGTVSRIEGIGLDEIARETLIRHRVGFPGRPVNVRRLDAGGVYQWKSNGEYHLFNPDTIHHLQNSTRNNDYQEFKQYANLVDDQSRRAYTLRGLFAFNPDRPAVPIEEVEPIENIFKRFATGAMSFGSISWEAHTTLAIAMNRIGGKSNSGEGGEDPIRYEKDENGDLRRSAIKQVASARFGVSSYYLTNCDEIQIKMAQGAKPGEGGQLPGHKVDSWIARVRNSTPGVGLISPPPHHDIYSIEDLAQLIHDLKSANREARINVKLVSEAGVGTVAAGVCKAKADVVLISGHDGGTGASPLSSIRHAGLPWELGLAETQQTLVKNKLRNRITVQTDGQIKTPRDLAIATLLGAEEWGVATAALVVQGCILLRQCHQNTCSVGIATQNPELRKRFNGKVEHVINFFTFMAQGLREIMAELGFRTINEMVGQVQCLQTREGIDYWKHKNLDLSAIFLKEEDGAEHGLFKTKTQDHRIAKQLDWQILTETRRVFDSGEKIKTKLRIKNTDRTVGALLSNEISKVFKQDGLPEDSIHALFNGTAGQSFGAFLAPGVKFELEGDANDYFGKSLSGGKLIVYPPKESTFTPSENIIIGNVAFYGATAGEAYIRGMAGERFCVRNSGAKVVVEGVGDHGCEYMTGGYAVILGRTGKNFAAGMSGGIAYVYDPEKQLNENCNQEMVDLDPLLDKDFDILKEMLQKHTEYTQSDIAAKIIKKWREESFKFIKVFPREFKNVLQNRADEKDSFTPFVTREVANG
ncbi:MAG: glutamate synthase large subunit [Calditrichaeota bacterium]|nr:glutamate synthase large subunit [Calditrichota bacterium]